MRQSRGAFGQVLRRCCLGLWVCGVTVQCGQPAEEQVVNPALSVTASGSESTPGTGPGLTAAPSGQAPSVTQTATVTNPQEPPQANNPPPLAGTPCVSEGWLQCVGAAQAARRICRGGVWTEGQACLPGEHCDQAIGTCLAVVEGCQGQASGYRFCDQSGAANTCGVDLTRVETEYCPHGCMQGRCMDECEGSTAPECLSSAPPNGACSSCETGETTPTPSATQPLDLPSGEGVLSEVFETGVGVDTSALEESSEPAAVAVCGDFVLQPGEACDDGNRSDSDGCSGSCALEKCGDDVRQNNEQCDDGNGADNDGCSSDCKNEVCGDRVIQSNEGCDDGNTNGNDGCSAECRSESCGDGTRQGQESCDDGNKNNNDGCSSECKNEECGDRILQSNEACDDGNKNSNDGCSSSCRKEECGDRIIQSSENCDDGNKNSNDGCSAQCRTEACGDNVKQNAEECEDGNQNNNDGCTNQCKREFCGDNVKQNHEACDDGNATPDDTCNAKCQVNKPLQEYDGSCNDATGGVSRSQACVSAVRRYCADMSGDLNLKAGVAQEIGAANNEFGVGCLDNVTEVTVSFEDLQKQNKGCGDPANAQKLGCLEAAHDYCDQNYGKEFGMIQAVSGNNATVVCDDALTFVKINEAQLTAKHSNCNADRAATADCAAAARRLCRELVDTPNGYEDVGGYVQAVIGEQVEADSYEMEVACLAFKVYDSSAKVAIE